MKINNQITPARSVFISIGTHDLIANKTKFKLSF